MLVPCEWMLWLLKKLGLAAALVLLFLGPGCSAKNAIKRRAEQAVAHASNAAAEVLWAREAVAQTADALSSAIPVANGLIVEAQKTPNPDLQAKADEVKSWIETASASNENAAGSLRKAQEQITRVKEAAAPISDLTERVRDKRSMWPWFLGAGLVVASLIYVLGPVRVAGWAASLVMVPLAFLRELFRSRWSGPAKLASEATSGKTSVNELVAALRGQFPGLDREMRKKNGR